jgi:hypothetical protein
MLYMALNMAHIRETSFKRHCSCLCSDTILICIMQCSLLRCKFKGIILYTKHETSLAISSDIMQAFSITTHWFKENAYILGGVKHLINVMSSFRKRVSIFRMNFSSCTLQIFFSYAKYSHWIQTYLPTTYHNP